MNTRLPLTAPPMDASRSLNIESGATAMQESNVPAAFDLHGVLAQPGLPQRADEAFGGRADPDKAYEVSHDDGRG